MAQPLDPTKFNLALLSLGGLLFFYALLSRFFKQQLYLSAPMFALVLGIFWGPVFHLFDLHAWGTQELILEELARLAIAVQLISTALHLESAYPFKHWRSLAIIIGPLMLSMWAISSLLVYVILNVDPWVAILIGAVLTPTDPVLASTIVTGKFAEKHLPDRVRHLLAAESGLNDGLAYPFVFLPLLMVIPSYSDPIAHWFSVIWLWDVGAAIVFGLVLGYFAGKLLKWSQRKKMMDKQSFLVYMVAVSFVALGGVKLIGSDGILAVFMAGVGFDLVVKGSERSEEENVQDALDLMTTTTMFALFGLALPWQDWLSLGWQGLLLVIAILLLRRLPVFLLLNRFIPHTKGYLDALFMGWFGPIGVAAIFYANLAAHKTGLHEVWSVVSLVILGSVIIHGISAVPLSIFYQQNISDQTNSKLPVKKRNSGIGNRE
ncbi:Sodium/hydrogen exchanger [Crocosphaera subtropica ATCC 51142]|uniref:Sodium/hydrogen exchanger n=1 Tax=Crocosphaera subtropica (strain ATCC 51142 / BH68) TaxID=43989 RepID=B1X0Q6_CROS5|nr:cation:proton antiporter [Crocosphaera subtropica]ACB52945.1 Sodium/hydrogen exchanger [Crocosphaera subtropica ATCC 51142]